MTYIQIKMFVITTVLATLTLITTTTPLSFAETVSTQDLTSLGTISTSVTGQPDSTFSQDEQKYQQQSVTSQTGWTGYCQQGGRDIEVLFPSPVDVNNVQITLEQNIAQGIYLPNEVQFQGYYDGQWYVLGTQNTVYPSTRTATASQIYQLNDANGIELRAVRVSFPVDVWVFAQGLDISGNTTSFGTIPYSPTYAPVSNNKVKTEPLSPILPNAFGIKNMLLISTGNYGSEGTWSANDFKPMLEYIDPMGYSIAPLFDTMLFLPYGNVTDNITGWTSYLNDLFTPNSELDALNQAVIQSNLDLNRPGHKEKVVLSIPYFPYGSNAFGTINGQDINFGGTTDDPNAIVSRTTAVDWYVNDLLSRWKAANYQNLQLVGLYWDREEYDPFNPGEAQLFQTVEQVAHNNGLPLLWIPFYGADGDTQWQSLGLSGAWLQPNYIEEGADANIDRISGATNTATDFGMGIEVEMTGLSSLDEQLYQTFLNNLDVDGFGADNVSHAFYDGSKLLLTAEQSNDPAERLLYDETADFIMTGVPSPVLDNAKQ